MGTELALPSAFANAAPVIVAGLNPLQDRLSDGIGGGYGIVRYFGGRWSLQYKGKQYPVVRPDDGTPAGYLDVIVLQSAAYKSKSFYPSFDPNNSAGKRPLCASLKGDVPDGGVTQPQSISCAICPRNELRIDPKSGSKHRECTDYKRLAVFVLPSITSRLLGEPLNEPMFLRVPASSLQSLSNMGDTMARAGFHYSTFVTRITFDTSVNHPKMVFTPLTPLTKPDVEGMMEMRNEGLCERILGDANAGVPTAQPAAPAQLFAQPQPTPLTAPVIQQPQFTPQPPAQIVHTTVAPAAVMAPTPAPVQELLPPPPAAGVSIFALPVGGVAPPAQPAPPVTLTLVPTVVQTPADTAAPAPIVAEESDAGLDEFVASLLKTSI